MPSPKHAVVLCLVADVENTLDSYQSEYDLVGMSSCQVGSGFGAHVEVILAFKLREEDQSAPPKSLPAGRQRRSPMAAVK